MSDREELDFELPEGDLPEGELSELENMSLEELLASTKEDLARVDALMGEGSGEEYTEEYPEEEPELDSPELTEEAPRSGEEKRPKKQRLSLPGPVRALVYVCCVLAVSVLLAVAAWLCADDVLALTKPEREVSVTVAEDSSIAQVTDTLKQQGLIKYEWLFKFYCWFSHAERKIQPGTYTLNNLYDYHALVSGMRAGAKERATVQVTIPEGYECADIFSELAAGGVCELTQLEEAAADYAFEYDFLEGLPYGDKNRLEGYLFPDTYEFFIGDDPVNVIDKFLRNFDRKLTEELRGAVDGVNRTLAAKMEQNGFSKVEIDQAKLSLHEIITVASLIEKETAKTSESASIASVIYNRLCSKLYPCLQIDATIQYVLPERKEILSNADKAFISPYNTYTNAGLPAGPIANPGINSIRAALYPADTNYYFYALNRDGVHSFSETYYEHQAILEEMKNG